MTCPRCQHENHPQAKFCEECAGPLKEASPVTRSHADDLKAEVESLRRALTESQEQQTATAEILRVISSSPTDVQPVFNSIAESATRLCDGIYSGVFRFDGKLMHFVAHYNWTPKALEMARHTWPRPPDRGSLAARAVLDRAVIHVPDVARDPEYRLMELAEAGRQLSILAVPMLQRGAPVGAITVSLAEPRPFSLKQIELVKTFAAQAVIAIENVRLFTELQEKNRALTEAHAQVMESLEQQTATAEILRVISSSPTDVQPVFDAIVRSAARLCDGVFGSLYRFDGELIHLAAAHNLPPEALEVARQIFPAPLTRELTVGRAILDRTVAHIPDVELDPEYKRSWARTVGARSALTVPMFREGNPIGTINVARAQPGPFSPKQIELLQTFADQAVIAIENVRLFTELESRNRELTDALEQQTATSEILRVISRSQTDVQPVFDAILRSAVRLCDGVFGNLFRFDGELVHHVADYNYTPEARELARRLFPAPPSRGLTGTRAILDRAVVHVPDIELDPEYDPALAQRVGTRSVLTVPMFREGSPVGSIAVGRAEPGPFSDNQIELLKTFADQAVIAIENVRLFNELEARNRDLTDSLEQQTATAEILRVIASSPTDLQPVLEAVVENAARVCGATNSAIYRLEDERLHLVALHGPMRRSMAIGDALPVDPGTVAGRIVRERRTIQVEDIMAAEAEFPVTVYRRRQAGLGSQSILGTPLLREGTPVGTLFINRGTGVQPFSAKQIALLETFANQAVIAIENVRLFKELQERNRDLTAALEREAASADLLRIIAASPTDLTPVFESILDRALILCGATMGGVLRYDGGLISLATAKGPSEVVAAVGATYPRRLDDSGLTVRSIRERRTVHVADTLADPSSLIATRSIRGQLSVPMLKDGKALGAIVVTRPEPGLFSDGQVKILETFADQAVIAIENVRLFTELEARNRELTESLEQQTATGEILRVIANSPTDLQPVMQAVVENTARLCGAIDSTIYRLEGEHLRKMARHGPLRSSLKVGDVIPVVPGTVSERILRDRRTIHIEDTLAAEVEFPVTAARARAGGSTIRTMVGTPLLREGRPLGVLYINRGPEPSPFSAKQIALLETFANQAVIAIENVRLFQELEARTRDLTRSVEELQALSAVSRTVSSTLDLPTVLTTIVSRAVQLAGAAGGVIYEYDDATQKFQLRASHRMEEELVEVLRAAPISLGEGATGQAALRREPVQLPDIGDAEAFSAIRIRTVLLQLGYRSVLAVPLLSEQRILGVLTVWRQAAGLFPEEVVHLLQTFAGQSALAIQNARLFREIADKSRQLEAASRHKSEFLANMSHELRTPLNAILGFSEVLAERMFGEVNDKQAEYLQDILSSGRHLLSLINDILDLSKVEAGRLELELGRFHLPTALDNALILVRERATRHGISLTQHVDPAVGDIVADERKVKQILLNLLSNAVKFTPEGGRVGLTATAGDSAITIAVSDTGIGIAPEDQAAIFEEFRQVGREDARKQEGTGLGLTLAKKFVELHRGRIRVESQVGQGSTFSFTLPVRLDEGGVSDQGGGESPRP